MSKFCDNCGAELKDNDKFCEKCGSSIKQEKNYIPIIIAGYIFSIFSYIFPLNINSSYIGFVLGATLPSIIGIIIAIYLLTRNQKSLLKHGILIIIISTIYLFIAVHSILYVF